MSYPFRNLVFEGGGVKGIAYVGAMQILESESILDSISRIKITWIDIKNTTLGILYEIL